MNAALVQEKGEIVTLEFGEARRMAGAPGVGSERKIRANASRSFCRSRGDKLAVRGGWLSRAGRSACKSKAFRSRLKGRYGTPRFLAKLPPTPGLVVMINCAAKSAAPGCAPLRVWCVVAGLAWAVFLALGTVLMLRHEFAAGELSEATPPRWPTAAGLERCADSPALVMAVHPHCPCSRASLEQLERIVSQSVRPVQAFVLFYDSIELEPGVAAGAVRKIASGHPGIHAVTDLDGRLARRFGASTSGEVMLYDTDGRLRYHGGITPSRGHSGPGKGGDTVLALIEGRAAAGESFPVFGCSIRNIW